MTAFDRFEQRLPELMDELAAARTPDYFDDMLRAAALTRQRPAWSALERWIPMGVLARPLPVQPFPWRLIAIAALVGLLAVAGLLYTGAQRRPVPPFGPASNGLLAIATADGDIVSVDLATGTTSPLINGPTLDSSPLFSNDGQRLLFYRQGNTPPTTLFVANADGSGAHALLPKGTEIQSFGWSSDSDRALILDAAGRLSIVNVTTGAATPIPLDLDVASATWRPNHDQIVVAARVPQNSADWVDANRTYWVVDADGSGTPRQIPVSQYAINEPTLTPDGTSLVYATWEPVTGPPRIVNIETGADRALISAPDSRYLWQKPILSPDGSRVLIYQMTQDTTIAQLSLISVANGTVTAFGPPSDNPQPEATFSPDGTKILAAYPTLGKTWIFDGDGSNGLEAAFSALEGSSWQRRAR